MKKIILILMIIGYATVCYAQNSRLNDFVNCLKVNSCNTSVNFYRGFNS